MNSKKIGFKKEFVKDLKTLLPDNIKKLDLIFPKVQTGFIRFNEFELNNVYFDNITDKKGNGIGVKFNYASKSYLFSRIYYLSDGCNEYGFDKELNLNAKYLRGISILSQLEQKEKLHLLNILEEWRDTNKALKKIGSNWVSAYQVEKNGELVKVPYLICADELEDKYQYRDIAKEITNNFDVNTCAWGCKCTINENIIKKEKSIYLVVDAEGTIANTDKNYIDEFLIQTKYE